MQAAAYYGRAADEARRLHGENFICTCLTLQQSANLSLQSSLEVVTPNEVRALYDEGWKLASSCLPLIICRMDANTMLPGRCTAVELAFSKWFGVTSRSKYCKPFFSSTRGLQLTGLCMGYCTAITAASLLLAWLHVRHDAEAEAFVLRVVDCMLPAVRSLRDRTSPNEECFAHTIQNALSGQPRPTYHAAFLASLRTKWTDDAMVQMRRERSLLDVSENIGENIEKVQTRWRADVAEHGLKCCSLPSCDKREASVQQYKFCSACRSVSYCSEEHGALHWKEHKPMCRATTAAQQAAADAVVGAA